MEELSCARARECLRAFLWSDPPVQLPAELGAHLSACAVCRTTLLLIDALKLSTVPAPIECERCREDLASFVEQERVDGPAGAIRAYPGLWWHLWTCQACLDAYDLVKAGLVAEPAARPAQLAPTKVVHLLHLARAFLNRALPAPSPVAVVTRGGDALPSIIAEEQAGGGAQLVLSVERQRHQDWTVIAIVIPAPAGNLLLTLGESSFRAPFGPDGRAVIVNVPAALLSDRAGPDMKLEIETAAANR